MNLTDNEIIKALECCVRSTSGNDCEKLNCPACKDFGCHYMDSSDRDDSYEALVEGLGKDALDLINRQKAEIERWRANYTLPKEGFFNVLCGALVYTKTLEEYNQFRRTIKAETIKEFADSIIHEIVNRPSEIQSTTAEYLNGSAHRQNEIIDVIKEMVGE